MLGRLVGSLSRVCGQAPSTSRLLGGLWGQSGLGVTSQQRDKTMGGRIFAPRSLDQMHEMGGPPIRRPRQRSPISGYPLVRGVVLKLLIKKPKKPNSANRKCVLVRTSSAANNKIITAFVPGEGHNLQEHSQVLIKGGRKKDLVGVKVRVVRGKLDCAPVRKPEQR